MNSIRQYDIYVIYIYIYSSTNHLKSIHLWFKFKWIKLILNIKILKLRNHRTRRLWTKRINTETFRSVLINGTLRNVLLLFFVNSNRLMEFNCYRSVPTLYLLCSNIWFNRNWRQSSTVWRVKLNRGAPGLCPEWRRLFLWSRVWY